MRKIIFWIPQGRIGNLIFQYQAVTSIYSKKEMIITVDTGFLSFFQDRRNIIFLKIPSLFLRRFVTCWTKLLRLFVLCGVFSECRPKLFEVIPGFFDETKHIELKLGLFKKIIVFEGFFQNESYLKNLPAIRQNLLEEARIELAKLPSGFKVALHLRFGDYQRLSVLGKVGATLPKDYYFHCIEKMKAIYPKCTFIVFTDDVDKSNKLLKNITNIKFIRVKSEQFDFSAITLCGAAIISASTFSWWAAKYITGSKKIIMAPEYWMGFKSNIWFPRFIKSNSIQYIKAKGFDYEEF
jgi:hypothetical protein